MRVLLVGAGSLAVMTAQQLLENDHDVVIIEKEQARIQELSAELDAGFIHGDGSRPDILREADPMTTDLLFCLTGSDQDNILASLVGRSLGFRRVVTRIENPTFEHVCIELGLTDIIVPDYSIARYLVDLCEGSNPLQLSAVIKGDARIFTFVARKRDQGRVSELKLPALSKVMFLYRNDDFLLVDAGTSIHAGDEIVMVTHSKALPELESRWAPVSITNRAVTATD